LRRGSSPPHAAPDGIRFAPQNDLHLHSDHAAHFYFSGAKPMTAYLISLALVGLVVIVVTEEFS